LSSSLLTAQIFLAAYRDQPDILADLDDLQRTQDDLNNATNERKILITNKYNEKKSRLIAKIRERQRL